MKAIIYCRVSTKEQTSNLSLPTQRKSCVEYCQKHGYSVDAIFTEEGESAKTADRPEFLKLLAYCRQKKGTIQALVVYSISRFARNSYDFHAVKGSLSKLGITLRYVTEQTDDTSTGKLMEGILAAFAQFDNDVRAERTVAGMKEAQERGRWTFQAPLGYLTSKGISDGFSIVPDPERAALVKKAFELYATGRYSKEELLRLVSNLGLRTRKGRSVSAQSFDKLLRNPLYAGWIVVRRWGEPKRGSFEPLVSEELFNCVQRVITGKTKSLVPHVRNHPDFPLRQSVRCGICNKPLTGSWSKGRNKRYAYYCCPARYCRAVKMRKENFEKLFVELLGRLNPLPEYLKLFKAILLEVWREKQAESVVQIAAIKDRLKKIEWQKQQLIDAFLYRRDINKAIFDEQMFRLKEDTDLAEMELHQLRLEELDVEALLDFSHHVLLSAGPLWMEASLAQKQKLQKVLFPEGLSFSEGNFRTAKTALIFQLLQTSNSEKATLVSPTGFEPVLLA
jgi:site-specific DNA recombinase